MPSSTPGNSNRTASNGSVTARKQKGASKPRGSHNAPAARAQNLSHLLHTLQRHQPISRIRLARMTGISTTTVTNLVHELVQAGIVVETGVDELATTPGAGRPPVAMRLDPQSRCAIGVHIGVRQARIGLVDLQANLLAMHSVPFSPLQFAQDGEGASIVRGEEPQATLARIATAIAAVVAAHEASGAPQRLVGIGVGASGLVQSGAGINVLAPRLGWRNVPLRDHLQNFLAQEAPSLVDAATRRALGNVVIDNNVRTMALAESLYGVCRNARALAFVYARVGVGAGLVVDRNLYRGADYGAGEIGHWVMKPRDGKLCGCGNRGCLETLISEDVLLAQAEAIQSELTRGRANPLQVVFEAARDGHLALVEMLEDRAYYVGLALANLVNVLNPQAILLGGWLSDAFDLIEPVASSVMRRHAFAGMADGVDLLPTSFGNYSGVIGAGVLALENYLFSPEANYA